MKIKALLLVALVLLTNCKKNEKNFEKDYISSIINTVVISDTVKWVIILPGMGCHGCIREGEVFMKDNIDNNTIFFILTKVESTKILQQKLEVNLKKYTNVYIDDKDNFKVPTKNSVYPCVVYLKGKKIESYEFQSPKNDAFKKLRDKID